MIGIMSGLARRVSQSLKSDSRGDGPTHKAVLPRPRCNEERGRGVVDKKGQVRSETKSGRGGEKGKCFDLSCFALGCCCTKE